MNKSLPAKSTASYITITANNAGQRIDNFLFKQLKGVPKSRVYRILRKGEVRVNKKRIGADYKLLEGDQLRIPPIRVADTVEKQQRIPSDSLQNLLKQAILYEDEGLLVINKPAGLAVHGGSGINWGVIETLRALFPEKKATLELVHRLDRDTSGCLLVTKKNAVLRELHELLRNNQVDKRYLLLVKGYWPKYLKEVDAPLHKYELASGERLVKVNAALGKQAVTQFRVLKRFADTTLLEAKLLTGRTHQIRVHALHAGHPLIGDEKYGDKDFNKIMKKRGANRLFLHAHQLTFTLKNGQTLALTAPVPVDFQKFLDKSL